MLNQEYIINHVNYTNMIEWYKNRYKMWTMNIIENDKMFCFLFDLWLDFIYFSLYTYVYLVLTHVLLTQYIIPL